MKRLQIWRMMNKGDIVKKGKSFLKEGAKPTFLEAGYFYAPYVPLTKTPTVIGEEWEWADFVDWSNLDVEYPDL